MTRSNTALVEPPSARSLLKSVDDGQKSVREKAESFIAYALLLLPENKPYLIPMDVSEEQRGDSLCRGTGFGWSTC